jgi:hypothetical protein
MRIASLVLTCGLLAGCNLYLSDDAPGGDDCTYGYIAANPTRDPQTGACLQRSDTNACGALVPQPDFDEAACTSQCTTLAETACLTAPGCHAAYEIGVELIVPKLLGCWGTAPSGPVETGSCAQLDAHECSRHDNCVAEYRAFGTPQSQFVLCADEPGATPCEGLTTESACTHQAGCVPVYAGADCTCYPGGCHCETETFERCGSTSPF